MNFRREPITRSMSFEKTIELMAENNKHAKKLFEKLVVIDPLLLLHLDDMNIRGTQAFVAFFGFCNGNMSHFKIAVKSRDRQMVDYVNRRCPMVKAVVKGGAAKL